MAQERLTEKLEQYIKDRVKSGQYGSASEVVRDALRLKMKQDATEAAKLEALRRDIDAAWQQADRGDFADFDPERINRELDAELESTGE